MLLLNVNVALLCIIWFLCMLKNLSGFPSFSSSLGACHDSLTPSSQLGGGGGGKKEKVFWDCVWFK